MPPLPALVRAALDAAPVVDLDPASVPVSLDVMDEEFTGAEAPIFDNLNYFCTAIRLTGFVNPGGADGLVLQMLWTGLGDSRISVNFGWYGFDGTTSWLNPKGLVVADEAETVAYRAGVRATLTLPNGTMAVDVRACLPASDSPDLVLAVEALRERRAVATAATGRTRDDNLRERMENIGGFGGRW